MRASHSTLGKLCGLSTRSVAELLVEVGGFARFNGTAPLAVSTAEGPGVPVRHRYNPGGDRRVNAVLHRMPSRSCAANRAKAIYDNARARGHSKREVRRILKRHLSDVVYRRMMRDLTTAAARFVLAAQPRPRVAQSRCSAPPDERP